MPKNAIDRPCSLLISKRCTVVSFPFIIHLNLASNVLKTPTHLTNEQIGHIYRFKTSNAKSSFQLLSFIASLYAIFSISLNNVCSREL